MNSKIFLNSKVIIKITHIKYSLKNLSKTEESMFNVNRNIKYSADQWKLYKVLYIDNNIIQSELFNKLDFEISYSTVDTSNISPHLLENPLIYSFK